METIHYDTLVGARATEENPYGWLMRAIGFHLAKQGRSMRSGAAAGADTFFEQGCDLAGGLKEIYLPWKGFRGVDGSPHPSMLYPSNLEPSAWEEAKRYVYEYIGADHVERLKYNKAREYQGEDAPAFRLQTRNAFQVLGRDLKTPSETLVCWTREGETHHSQCSPGTGTRQAIRIASHYNERPDRRHDIQIFNLARDDHRAQVMGIVRPKESYPEETGGIIVLNYHRAPGGKDAGRCLMRGHSALANPFRVVEAGGLFHRGEACAAYDVWLRLQLRAKNPPVMAAMSALWTEWRKTGELRLVCCCYPADCHCRVVREILLENQAKREGAPG